MNLPTSISITAASVELVIALLVLRLSRAPGWRGLQAFAFVALSAAAFSANNIASAWQGAPEALLLLLRFNISIACVHLAAWVVYTRAVCGGDAQLTPVDRGLLGVLALLFTLPFFPGAIASDELRDQTVRGLDVTYRVPDFELLTLFVCAFLLGLMLVLLLRFARAALAGQPGARAHVLGFAFFFASVGNEVLVTFDVYHFMYIADIGVLAMVLVVLAEIARRVVNDASALAALSTRLEHEVEARSAELIEARDALLRAERLASLGQLAAGVGHEINNPLTAVDASLRLIEEHFAKTPQPADLRECLQDALECSERIRRVVSELRVFARAEQGEQLETVNLTDAVASAIKMASHQIRHRAQVKLQIDDVFTVTADRARLGQVFVNLLVNAAQAIPEDSKPESSVIRVLVYAGDADRAVVEFSDPGVGIDEEHMAHLFEPYYTTRASSGGTGLGLFISHGIVAGLGGRLELQSKKGVGTKARVHLPATRKRGHRATPEFIALPRTPVQRPALRVLVVDDDAMVARALGRVLRAHHVTTARDGATALDEIARQPAFDVIVCDLMMPNVSGMDLYESIERTKPELTKRFVFVTGGAVTERARRFLGRELHWLPKPVDAGALHEMIDTIVAGSPQPAGQHATA